MAPIDALPPELLDRVFDLLSRHRADISSCRLVARHFKDLSSPHLIRTVVFAPRYRELHKLQEVLEHTYLCRHVTDLLYDNSVYLSEVTRDFETYLHYVRQAYFHRYVNDEDWCAAQDEDQIAKCALRAHWDSSEQAELDREIDTTGLFVEEDEYPDEHPDSSSDSSRERRRERRATPRPSAGWTGTILPELWDEDKWKPLAYRLGSHKGFADY